MRDLIGGIKKFLTREVIIFLIIVLALAILSVLFLVVKSVLTESQQTKADFSPPVLGRTEEGAGDFTMYDLILPDEIERFLTPSYRYYREPRDSWSREEVDTYWVDPRSLGIEILKRENRRYLDDFFEKVP